MAAEGGPNGPDPGGTLINGRFRPTKKLGSGSFGEIYMGIGTSGEKVAIKFEKAGLRCPQLRHEYKVRDHAAFIASYVRGCQRV